VDAAGVVGRTGHGAERTHATFPLHGLDAAARYVVSNLDTGEQVALAGTELMTPGLAVHLEARPDSALIVYRK
jgi:hypothetical protein